jgi:hypothetical protein
VTRGIITLGRVADFLTVLRVACNRCPRHGQLRTDRLLAEHGPAFPMPSLRQVIAADCPRMQSGEMSDPCGMHFPQLPELFG